MKLQEYFDEVKHLNLSLEEKDNIYRKFLIKSERIPFYRKSMFYVRISIYLVFLMGLYTLTIGDIKNVETPINQISKLSTGYFLDKAQDTPNVVKAQPLGRIVETNGSIKINDGSNLGTGFINSGDVVLLGAGANLRFQVDSGALAAISGPAKFSIERGIKNDKEIYVINLIYGNYFEIKSSDKMGTGVVIKTDKFELSQKDLENKMDLKIIVKGKKQIIENNGGELILVKKVKNKDVTSSIKTNQTVELDQDAKAYAEVKQIESDFKDQKVESSFDISSSGQESTGTVKLDTFTGDIKKVLSEEKLDTLKNILSTMSLNLNSRNLLISYAQGNDEMLKIIYKNYLDMFERAYDMMGVDSSDHIKNIFKNKSTADIKDLMDVCKDLQNLLDSKYYIPTKYDTILMQLHRQFETLQSLEKGKLQKEDVDFDSIILKLNIDKDIFIIK